MKRVIAVILLTVLCFATMAQDFVVMDGGEVVLTFGGDCILASDRGESGESDSFEQTVLQKGMDWPFSGIKDLFSQDDLTLINLECVLHPSEEGFTRRQHNFRGDPAYAAMLRRASVEVVNVANNHFVDYGYRGKQSTYLALEAAGVAYAGYENLYVREVNGFLIGFGGIRETIWLGNKKIMDTDIAELKAQGCDLIIYSLHFGIEYEEKHNELQTEMAQRAIDLGADIVVGTHPHVVQGIEQYQGGLILYSLGNLVFGGNRSLTVFDGLLVRVRVPFFSGGVRGDMEVELIPVATTGAIPANDFRPILLEGARKQEVIQLIQNDTDFPISETVIVERIVQQDKLVADN